METKEVKLSNGKTYVVKEILFKSITDLQDTAKDKGLLLKELLKLSTGMTDEDYESLTMRNGIALQKVFNEINGLTEDFLAQQSNSDLSQS